MNAKPVAWQRGGPLAVGVLRLGEVKNRTSGGFPFLYKHLIIAYPLFSLKPEAQRKKLSKKEMPKKGFRLCGGDQRSARWMGGRFLKKATQKLSTKHRREVPNKSKFESNNPESNLLSGLFILPHTPSCLAFGSFRQSRRSLRGRARRRFYIEVPCFRVRENGAAASSPRAR